MNIEGLGDETVQLLYDNGLVHDISDLYTLKRADLVRLPRLGEKSADNILRNIEASKQVPFARVLFAIGIRFIGETTAKILARQFKNIDALIHADPEQLIEAEEVGERLPAVLLNTLRMQRICGLLSACDLMVFNFRIKFRKERQIVWLD